MSEHLNSEEEDLLQSALSTAFSPAPLPRQSAEPEPVPATAAEASVTQPSVPAPTETPANTGDAENAEEVWKAEYEAQLAEWRRQSAGQRQKAEATRAQWEAIREQERKEGKSRQSVLSESTSGWENLGGSVAASSVAAASPSPADARDLVSGEGQGGHSKEYLESVLPGASTSTSTPPSHEKSPSQPASEPESKQDKWDSMTSSLTSSFPSMSFPSDPHSPISSTAPRDLPPHRGQPHSHATGHSHGHAHAHHHHHHDEPQRTASLSVFDSSLSPKTRTLALLSSLAINVLLPFINGVMLGFGEIFAKNLVGWLGWKVPGTASASTSRGSGRVASGVGLGRK